MDEIDLFDDLSEVQRRYDLRANYSNIKSEIIVGAVICGQVPTYRLSDGDDVCLKKFSMSCEAESWRIKTFVNDYLHSNEDMDLKIRMNSFNKLILSTGFTLE